MKWLILSLAGIAFVILLTSGDPKSYRGGKDLIEEWYGDLVDKDASLEQLEKDIAAIEKRLSELQAKFADYNSVSSEFYSAGFQKATLIRDTSVSNHIKKLLLESQGRYNARTAALNNLMQALSQKNISQHDYHVALKIVKTLPMMEKYQQAYIPGTEEYNSLLNKLNEVVKRMESQVK
jgi:hypothetical protein